MDAVCLRYSLSTPLTTILRQPQLMVLMARWQMRVTSDCERRVVTVITDTLWHDSLFYSTKMRRGGRTWSPHKIRHQEPLVTNFLPASWFLTDVVKKFFREALSLGFGEDPKERFLLWSYCGLRVNVPENKVEISQLLQLEVNKRIHTGRWRLWPRELPNGSSPFDHRSPKVLLSKSAALCVCVCVCVRECVGLPGDRFSM